MTAKDASDLVPSVWQGQTRVNNFCFPLFFLNSPRADGTGLWNEHWADRGGRNHVRHIHAQSSTLLFSAVLKGEETGSPSPHVVMSYVSHIRLGSK